MDPFFMSLISQFGIPGAIVIAVVYFFLTGKIVPKSIFQQMIADRDYWKAAYDKSSQTNELLNKAVNEMLEQGKTIQHFLDSLPKKVDPNRNEEE